MSTAEKALAILDNANVDLKIDYVEAYSIAYNAYQEKDYAKALKYYTIIADLGSYHAYEILGYLYQKGYGCDRDLAKAIEYYKRASYLGSSYGEYMLGGFYEAGIYLKRDLSLAYRCYRESAFRGYSYAKEKLEELGISLNDDYRYHDLSIYHKNLNDILNTALSYTNNRLAFSYALKLRDMDDPLGYLILGQMQVTEEESILPKNYKEAAESLRYAASLGSMVAMAQCSRLYTLRKDGLEYSPKKAYQMASLGAIYNMTEANTTLAYMYMGDEFGIKNYTKAISYSFKAVADKNPMACYNLAVCYLKGKGVRVDFALSFKYMKIAADGGCKEAIELMPYYYYHGIGVKKDMHQCLYYTNKAVALGLGTGYYYLSLLHFDGKVVNEDLDRALFLMDSAVRVLYEESSSFHEVSDIYYRDALRLREEFTRLKRERDKIKKY